MKRFSVLLVAAIFAAGIGWLFFDRKPSMRAEQEPKKPIEIPLKSIYSTSRQAGLKVMDQGHGDEGFENQMSELHQQSIKMGASNVFLAQGDDIAAAVKATWGVFTHGQPADEPADLSRQSDSEQFWLAAYLGVTGSDPPGRLVKSVEVSGQDIRMTVTNPYASSRDKHPYFFWIPVGKLKAGTYVLQLVDADQQHVSLLRRVKIPAK